MSDLPAGAVRLHELQRFRENRLALVAGVAALAGCVGLAFVPGPGRWIGLAVLGGVGFLLLFGHLRTEIRDDGLHVQMFPLTRRHRFGWNEIRSCAARTYRPILEYGGWGVRWGRSGKAYNVRGNRGVQLELANGRRLLIGSQRADELAAAISERLPARRR